MPDFWSIVNEAQAKELKEFEDKHEEERKKSEALRLIHNPGTISGRELAPRRDGEESQLTKQLDEIDEASRKAEKDAKDADRPLEGAFPPPPTHSG